MIISVSTCAAIFVCSMFVIFRHQVVSIYTQDEVVADFAATAVAAFAIAFFFDWTQCLLSGVIKAVRKQGIAALASFLCMVCISLPTGYFAGVKAGHGLPGIFLGYGLSSFCLGSIYLVILSRVDWFAVAEVASRDEKEAERLEREIEFGKDLEGKGLG